MKFFKKNEPELVEVKGNQLTCPVCSNKYFWSRKAQLNTSVASFFGLDWANRVLLPVLFVRTVLNIYWFLG